MKFAPLILPALMAVILSGVHLLPKASEMAPSAISMDLPEKLGSWVYRLKPPSQEEIDLLAADTEFAKAVCVSPREGEYTAITGDAILDRIDFSVVLSGHDLNNSIHRPERCMPSQGHVIGSSSTVAIELPNGQIIPTRRLLSVQSIATNEDRSEYANYQCVTYYFFVGHNSITQDHLRRTLTDIKDRLLFGMDQRWAYVSASMWYGEVPQIAGKVTLEEADDKLQKLLKDFSAEQIDWEQVK